MSKISIWRVKCPIALQGLQDEIQLLTWPLSIPPAAQTFPLGSTKLLTVS